MRINCMKAIRLHGWHQKCHVSLAVVAAEHSASSSPSHRGHAGFSRLLSASRIWLISSGENVTGVGERLGTMGTCLPVLGEATQPTKPTGRSSLRTITNDEAHGTENPARLFNLLHHKTLQSAMANMWLSAAERVLSDTRARGVTRCHVAHM